ncbi:hypothetical protein H0H92_001854, partial [Tricholoma furcatifolium]
FVGGLKTSRWILAKILAASTRRTLKTKGEDVDDETGDAGKTWDGKEDEDEDLIENNKMTRKKMKISMMRTDLHDDIDGVRIGGGDLEEDDEPGNTDDRRSDKGSEDDYLENAAAGNIEEAFNMGYADAFLTGAAQNGGGIFIHHRHDTRKPAPPHDVIQCVSLLATVTRSLASLKDKGLAAPQASTLSAPNDPWHPRRPCQCKKIAGTPQQRSHLSQQQLTHR